MSSSRGTDYHSHRFRPDGTVTEAHSKTPERALEQSHRGAMPTHGPSPDEYRGNGKLNISPAHEAEGRIGADQHLPPAPPRDRATAPTAEAEAERREHTGAPLK